MSTLASMAPPQQTYESKIMLNSVISTPGAKFMIKDVKKFYLNTPMTRYEYLWLCMSNILDDVKQHYQLQQKATNNGYIYVEIRKGIYGLPQVGQLAQDLLECCLKQHGYPQSQITAVLWLCKTRNFKFCLVIHDAKHLQTILTKYYEVSTD